MHKIITIINKFVKPIEGILVKLSLLIFRILFFFLPIYIIFLIAVQFYSISPHNKPSSQQYYILFVSIGITSTLSGLSFRAGSICEDKDRKRIFYRQGLRLLHATMLFMFSIPLFYIYNEINLINKLSIVTSFGNYINIDISKIINGLCFIFACFFFTFGLLLAEYAFIVLNKTLWEEKLLD